MNETLGHVQIVTSGKMKIEAQESCSRRTRREDRKRYTKERYDRTKANERKIFCYSARLDFFADLVLRTTPPPLAGESKSGSTSLVAVATAAGLLF